MFSPAKSFRSLHFSYRAAIAALLITATALAFWAFCWEPSTRITRNRTLGLARWPDSCSGLRVAVLSDLHVGSRHFGVEDLKEVVDETAAADPDLILLAGDYIRGGRGGAWVSPEVIADGLSGLTAPLGVYGVIGNHDAWFDASRVEHAFESRGITILENRSIELVLDDCRFWVAGFGDFRLDRHEVASTLANIPTDEPIVALTHNPDLFPFLPERVHLGIAGHTHGGQVDLPLLGRLIVPSMYGERYASGAVRESQQVFFTTPGLGTSILAVRFRVPPEISLLTLESRPKFLTTRSVPVASQHAACPLPDPLVEAVDCEKTDSIVSRSAPDQSSTGVSTNADTSPT